MANNKHERRVKGKVKQVRRVRMMSAGKYGLAYVQAVGERWLHKLKTMSTPCSCPGCSPGKEIKKKGEVKANQKLLAEELKFHDERFDDDDIDVLNDVI